MFKLLFFSCHTVYPVYSVVFVLEANMGISLGYDFLKLGVDDLR